jgi:hypothetical protein
MTSRVGEVRRLSGVLDAFADDAEAHVACDDEDGLK